MLYSQRQKNKASATVISKVQNATAINFHHVPPHNIDAERGVLGGILLQNERCNEVLDLLRVEDFYDPKHVLLYTTCIELFNQNKAIDLVTVAEALQGKNQLEQAGGVQYLAELGNLSITAVYIVDYAHIVRNKALQRRLIETATSIIQESYAAPEDAVKTLLDESEQKIFAITERTLETSFTNTKQILDQVFATLEERYKTGTSLTGVPTGYKQLDDLTAGMQPSELIILAARPSMGKTAFALNIALRATVQHNIPCAFFSLEMASQDLMQRMLAIYGKVDLANIRRGKLSSGDWNNLAKASEALSTAPLFIDDTPRGLTTLDLRARARRLKAQHGLGLVVVDYLQLMRSSIRTDSREQEVAEISRSLKAIAKELNVPVIALAQLNRGVEQRTDKKPLLSDLRESGSIEQDADVIMFIHREDVYRKGEEHPKKGIADIIIGKQRNGAIGEVQLRYFGEYTCFENLDMRY